MELFIPGTYKHFLHSIISSVDIDEDILRRNSVRAEPMLCDYLKRRPEQLIIEVYRGSIDTMHDCLLQTDVVIGIEIIEHLFPETLENVPFNIFGMMKPKIVVFTTPNADMNILFNMQTQFRHDDHKFEWSRQQFEEWALNLCLRYPEYMVSFHGIGPGPLDHSHLGCVSQLALFVRSDFWFATSRPATEPIPPVPCSEMKFVPEIAFEDSNEYQLDETSEQIIKFPECDKSNGNPESLDGITGNLEVVSLPHIDSEYKILCRHVYPLNVDKRSKEQRLLDEAKYHISRCEYTDDTFLNYDRYVYEVPLLLVSQNIEQEDHTIDELRKLLIENRYTITDNDVIEFEEETQSDEEDYIETPMEKNECNPTAGENEDVEEVW